MFLENLLASLLAAILASTSFGASINSVPTPRAFAQVTQSGDTRAVIDEISPEAGPTGTKVTLTGERFEDDNIVRFGKGMITNPTVSEDGTTLSFVVPEEMGRYCPPNRICTAIAYEVTPGEYNVRVQDGNRRSNVVTFEVTATSTEPDKPLSIEEISGPSNLEVGEEGTWTVQVESESKENLRYSVKWGDENWSPLRLFSSDDHTQSSATFTHTYHATGTYQLEFKVTDEEGREVASTTKVIVGEDESDIPHITTLTPASVEVGGKVTITGTGFDTDSTVALGTTSALEVDVVSDTQITFTVPNLALATYAVTVTDNDGTSNKADLKVVDMGKVSIHGINAPVKLQVGEKGTWTVDADTNSSGNLTYSVDWGEGVMARALSNGSTTQTSATFTHAYNTAGTYHPTFSVTDENGHTASVSASVVVEDTE